MSAVVQLRPGGVRGGEAVGPGSVPPTPRSDRHPDWRQPETPFDHGYGTDPTVLLALVKDAATTDEIPRLLAFLGEVETVALNYLTAGCGPARKVASKAELELIRRIRVQLTETQR